MDLDCSDNMKQHHIYDYGNKVHLFTRDCSATAAQEGYLPFIILSAGLALLQKEGFSVSVYIR